VPSRNDYVTRPLLKVAIHPDINTPTAISDRTVLTVSKVTDEEHPPA
jgi:hypothetical protein